MKHTTVRTLLLGSMAIGTCSMSAAQFMYKPVPYDHDTRFERVCLSTINVSMGGGSSRHGYNDSGNETGTLNIYGLHNMGKLGNGLTGLVLGNNYDDILIGLTNLNPINPDTNPFGKLEFSGVFNHFSVNISFIQNLNNGFFLRADLPIQKTQVNEIIYVDQGSATGNPANTVVPWQNFLTNFDTILNKFGLSKDPVSATGIGDVQMLAGWTTNMEPIAFDSFNATIMAGLSCPSAANKNEDQAFSIAAGHDGHFGCPISFNANVGFAESFSLGFHIGGTVFFSKIKNMRLMTDKYQNGFIVLGKGDAKRNRGTILNVGTSLKIGPIFKGLSFTFAYDFTRQGNSSLTPSDETKFSASNANFDTKLLSWLRHDLHCSAEYDFSSEGARFNPRVGLFFSMPINGSKRIFKTKNSGGFGGMSVVWDI